ncbi:MAG: GAF domain-containing protein [Puniceicoccales bacterium]|jgi:signal transduction histidine kinase|nr:GAF domain-containing protein [Puniceicoccales bacterium]
MNTTPDFAARGAPLSVSGGRPAALDCLYRIGSLVNGTEDPREALDLILDEIVRVLGASSASIALVDPDTALLRIEVSRGHEAGVPEANLALGQGITGWVALHARPVLVADVSQDNRYYELKPGIRSELAVPMEMMGQVIGVVNCDSDRTHAFTEADQAFLGLLTNEATKVIGRLWLLRQFKAKAAQLETIILAAQSLVHERDLPRIVSDLAEHTRQLAACRAVAVYSVSGDMLRLEHLAGELGGSGLAAEIDRRDTSLGVVAARARQVEVFHAGRNEEFLFEKLELPMADTSLLATPVVFDNEVLDVLLVIQGGPHRFSNDEKRLLATIASIGASALQNARLYSRVFSSEESLRRGERLTALGLLSAEIAHEIRNPLTVIKLLFDTLDLHFAPGDVRGQDLQVIREKLAHLEEIVSRVLNYGRHQSGAFVRIDLGGVIADTLLLMRLKFEQSRVKVDFQPPEANHWIEADKGQVQQVLLNLFLNAIQAMPDGGAIGIRLWHDADAPGGAQVRIQISDTGPGIPAEVRSRVFESFLTGRKEGTGLGLAIVKRIMRSHHGDIDVESSGPSGTVFALRFPAG